MQLKIFHSLYLDATIGRGRGVFTREALPPMKTIEISSVLVMDASARKLLDQTPLHDYIFEWGTEAGQCCVGWGYVSMYNHSYEANCEYFMDFEEEQITIKTTRAILAGAELMINYNGDSGNQKEVWFPVR